MPRVEVVGEPVAVERLVLAEQGLGSGELLNGRPEARAFLRGRMAAVPPEGAGRRFYVSRTGQPARRGKVLDEEGLEALFAAAGYEVIRPEDYPLERQVAMFRAASHVVATEGSPLHLLSFAASEGCRVAVIRRRLSAVSGQIVESLRWFLGTLPLVFDEVVTVHARVGGRSENFTYLEPSRVALRAGLGAAGFFAADVAEWRERAEREFPLSGAAAGCVAGGAGGGGVSGGRCGGLAGIGRGRAGRCGAAAGGGVGAQAALGRSGGAGRAGRCRDGIGRDRGLTERAGGFAPPDPRRIFGARGRPEGLCRE